MDRRLWGKILKKPRTSPAATGSLDLPAADIKGVGQTIAARLAKLGVNSVRDILYFFPRRFMDFSHRRTVSTLEIGKEQTIFVNVWEARQVMLGRMKSTEAVLGDETGNVRAVWFNQPWLAKQLKVNARVALSGRVSEFNYVKVIRESRVGGCRRQGTPAYGAHGSRLPVDRWSLPQAGQGHGQECAGRRTWGACPNSYRLRFPAALRTDGFAGCGHAGALSA